MSLYALDGDDVVLILPGIGRTRVGPDGSGTAHPDPGAAPDAHDLLLGVAEHTSRVRRGRFGLRGSAVEVGGRAVVVTGEGALLGRSSLAAALALRGHGVLGDEWVTWDEAGVVRGDGPSVALAPAAAVHLGLDPAAAVPVRAGSLRSRYLFAAGRPAPLELVVVVKQADVDGPAVRRVRGVEALTSVARGGASAPVVRLLELEARQLQWLAAGLRGATVLTAEVPRAGWYVGHLADVVEAALQAELAS